MESNNKPKTEILTLGGKSIYAGANWQTFKPKLSALASLRVRQEAQMQSLHWGAIHHVVDNGNYQYILMDDTLLSEQPLVGAALVADKLLPMAKVAPEETLVFIKLIDDEGFNQRYWLTAVSANGEILDGYDRILQDEHELISFINELTITENIHFSYLEFESNIGELAARINETNETSFKITVLDSDAVDSAISRSESTIRQYYKPSKLQVKKVALISTLMVAVVGAAFTWSFLTQKDAFDYFDNIDTLEQSERKSNKIDSALKKKKASKKWSKSSFRDAVLDQFIGDMQGTLYSAEQIALTIKNIERNLPLYVAEWQVSKIGYIHNRFQVFYTRIKNSKGVYFLLDEQLEMHNAAIDELDILPSRLLDNGNTRVYQVTPKITLGKQAYYSALKTKLQSERKLEKTIIASQQKLSRTYGDIENAFSDAERLTFSQRWLERKTNSLYADAERAESDAKDQERRLSKLMTKKKSSKQLELDDSLILGNTMDFVTMMQLDSLFEWSFPALDRTFPDGNSLKKKNRKPKKKGSKASSKTTKIYQAAIESYNVEISTQNKESEGKVKSYGISDMLQLGFLINKPYIQVDVVEYDKFTEQWRLKLHFYRKTNEYDESVSITTPELEGKR
jgi:hypothetical protein